MDGAGDCTSRKPNAGRRAGPRLTLGRPVRRRRVSVSGRLLMMSCDLGIHRRHECLRRFPRMIRGLGDSPEVGLHRMAERRQRDEWPALKQCAAQFPLQRADGVGQGRLRDSAALGSAGKIAFLAERQEVANLVHLHVDSDAADHPRWACCHSAPLSKVSHFTLGRIFPAVICKCIPTRCVCCSLTLGI
jgi:hypothetical protein